MRYSTGHKAKTKAHIVRSAGKLFAAKGFEATSIDEIMRACKLTRGGFYAHFRSKSQLYRHAIESAAEQSKARIRYLGNDGMEWIESMLNEYLDFSVPQRVGSKAHLTFFAADVASDDHDVRSAYGSAFNAMRAHMASRIAAHSPCSEETILAITVLIVGARAIAQSVDDETLKETLLASCRTAVRALLENRSDAPLSFLWEARLDQAGREHVNAFC